MIRSALFLIACLTTCTVPSLSQAASGAHNAQPKIAAFDILWRTPAAKGRRFTSASVTFQTPRRIPRRALVTVVPLAPRLRPFAIHVSSVTQATGCTDISQVYTARLTGIRRRAILRIRALKGRRADAPIDVAIIYPVNRKARFLPLSKRIRAMLPAKIFKVRWMTRAYAIDLTGNRRPDIVFVENNHARARTWARRATGWQVIDSTQPC